MQIFYVEDNHLVRNTIRETLELEGWTVEAFADGWAGLKEIESDAHYNLILLDNDLPLIEGLEFALRTRSTSAYAGVVPRERQSGTSVRG